MSDASVFWSLVTASIIAAIVLAALVSRGVEVGCASVFALWMALCFFLVFGTITVMVTGWNWMTYAVTDGQCGHLRDCYRGGR